MMHYYYDRPFDHGFHAFGLIGGLLSFLLWVLVITLIFRLVVRHGHGHFGHFRDHHDTPLEIAKARYAKGDISKAEFDDIKKNIA